MRNQFARVFETRPRSSIRSLRLILFFRGDELSFVMGFRDFGSRCLSIDMARLGTLINSTRITWNLRFFDIPTRYIKVLEIYECVWILYGNGIRDRIFLFFFSLSGRFNELFDRFENSVWRNLIWLNLELWWNLRFHETWYYKFPISFYSVKLNVLGYSTL